jgi:Golgi SNAP receptor complex protein 1
MSWENARRHARALETALDAKLATYSRIANTITRGPGQGSSDDGPGGYKLVEEEMEELISKVRDRQTGCLTSA